MLSPCRNQGTTSTSSRSRRSLRSTTKAVIAALLVVATVLVNNFRLESPRTSNSYVNNNNHHPKEIHTKVPTVDNQSMSSNSNGNAASSNSIILHQILPANGGLEKYRQYVESWDLDTTITPSIRLQHKFYKDDELYPFVELLNSTYLLDGWRNMKRKIEKVDFARYALLYLYGGLYADADQELVNSTTLQELLLLLPQSTITPPNEDPTTTATTPTIILPLEQGGRWNAAPQVGQALMISFRKYEPFWWNLMEYIIEQYNPNCTVLTNTGPLAMTSFWNHIHSTPRQPRRRGREEEQTQSAYSYSPDNNNQSRSISSNNNTNENDHYPNVRLSRLLDGRYDPTIFNQSFTIHHMGGSWITDSNSKDPVSPAQVCKDKFTWYCNQCEEYLLP